MLDDYTSGAFSISNATPISDNSTIVSPLSNNRWVRGAGSINWSSSVDAALGSLSYTLTLPRGDAPSPSTLLDITYSSTSENLNLFGYNAFVLNVSEVSGIGIVYAFEGVSSTLSGVVSVAFNGSGDLVIPFENMNAVNTVNPSAVTFRIVPQSADFSVTLSNITVIPEPSVALLAMLSASSFLVRRSPRIT